MLNPASPEFIASLRGTLPAATFRDAKPGYLQEPRGRWSGMGEVLAPATTEEVAAIVRACAAARVGIVPYGGGTGLVGGQIYPEGPMPIILSLERMRRIRAVYPAENVLIADGGTILADIQAAAEAEDRLFPLSLASEGSARIGGLLATNAGGVNVLRYGNARAQCLGLEVVTADGIIWNGLSRLRKDNTGYDLRDLIIGSEGTLGIITAASLRLMPRPASYGTALFAVSSPEAALSLLAMTQSQVGESVSAFELMHRQGLDFLAEVGPEIRLPFEATPEWMVLIDLGLPVGIAAQSALEALFEAAFEAGLAQDGVIAQSEAQRAAFWSIRESIPEANRRIGSVSSHDISLPLSAVPDFIRQGKDAIDRIGSFRINCFGHLGDGNLHYNVFPQMGQSAADHLAERAQVKTALHDLTHAMDGSVSAEHGIGRLKVDDLEKYGDPVKLLMMRSIKAALDPLGILNPGAVLRQA